MLPVTSNTSPVSRAERRTRTRASILEAARFLFRDNGYQRTTIRAIARRAGVDPALVMQHFGSKEVLFNEASDITFDLADALPGPQDELGERILRYLLDQLDREPDATLSALRSMLTHDQAAENVRCAFLDDAAEKIAAALPAGEGELRSGLICTMLVGLMVTRHLLKIDAVATSSTDQLVDLLGPSLLPLVRGQDRDGKAPVPVLRAG
jgi:AcrR family transcriptional regulator